MVAEKQVNNEELLQLAIRAAKNGQKDNARIMLRQVLQRNPSNETAMLWMAKIANSEQERIRWLKRVTEINPDNRVAQKTLDRMSYTRAATENRMLFVFGGIAAVMIIITIVVLLLIIST